MKFLKKKKKKQKDAIKNKIINLKKKNELLKEKKNQNDKKVEKYEKIIEKNKEFIKNIKQNNTIEGKNEKRKYNNRTLDRRNLKLGNNLRLMTDMNNMNQSENINTKLENQEDSEKAHQLTLTNENIIKYENTEIPNDKLANKNKSNQKIKKIKKSKSNDKVNDSKDKSLEKNKSNDEIFASSQTNRTKNIIITKNTKILLKKTGKQYKINKGNKEKKENQLNPKYNKNIYIINNINNSEHIQTKNNIYDSKSNSININSNGNLNYYNSYNQDFKANNRNVNHTEINENKNEPYISNASRNNPLIKINNTLGNKNTNQEKDAKNKTNYNFHDILQVNTKRNNEKNYKVENKVFSSSNTYNSAENKTQRIFQKNSYDYKNANNKGNNTNSGKNIYGKYSENIIKTTDNIKRNTGLNNTNNSYKISVYSKRSEKNTQKIK
jgi:hypothetical protein